MKNIRFFLDDHQVCETQKAVLLAFVEDLKKHKNTEIVLASELTKPYKWDDVAEVASTNLWLRLEAFQPLAHTVTVFLPGHIIPAHIESFEISETTLETSKFTTVAYLDFFFVHNDSMEVKKFNEFIKENPTYEAVSNYSSFSTKNFQEWLMKSGIKSALLFTDRPWYNSNARYRSQWLEWVKIAIQKKYLTLSMIESDILNKKVRPSLLQDVKTIIQTGVEPKISIYATLDTMFSYPEIRLTDEQYQMLHSSQLQTRTLKNMRASKKLKKTSLKKLLKCILSLPYRVVYKVYAIIFNILIRLLRFKKIT